MSVDSFLRFGLPIGTIPSTGGDTIGEFQAPSNPELDPVDNRSRLVKLRLVRSPAPPVPLSTPPKTVTVSHVVRCSSRAVARPSSHREVASRRSWAASAECRSNSFTSRLGTVDGDVGVSREPSWVVDLENVLEMDLRVERRTRRSAGTRRGCTEGDGERVDDPSGEGRDRFEENASDLQERQGQY